MVAPDNQVTLKSTVAELFKAKNFYDVEGRLTSRYEAPLTARHGDPCVLTALTYDGASRRIDAQKEVLATWDSSWDIP